LYANTENISKDPFNCTKDATGKTRPHVNDCTIYIECLNGEPEIRKCPNETAFDPDVGVCNYYPDVLDKCVNGTNYTSTPELFETTTIELPTASTGK
jgi:hypothetical protein